MGFSTAAAIAVPAVTTLATTAMRNSATRDASNQMAQSTDDSNKLRWDMYQQNRQDTMPFLDTGTQAAKNIMWEMGPQGRYNTMYSYPKFKMPTDWKTDPGYQFAKSEMLNSLLATGAAKGNYGSGNMADDLIKRVNNLADLEYDKVYNRNLGEYKLGYGQDYGQYNDYFNKLAGVAGMGQSTSQALNALGATTANSMGDAALRSALAQGQYGIQGAEATTQGLNNLSNIATDAFGYQSRLQQQKELLNSYLYGTTSGYNSGQGYGALNSISPATYDAFGQMYNIDQGGGSSAPIEGPTGEAWGDYWNYMY